MDFNMQEEVWKEIKGFNGAYFVSNYGRIKSVDRLNGIGNKVKGKLRKTFINNKGYEKIHLYKGSNSTKKQYFVHRLVAETFLHPYEGETVNHKDTNKLNNRLDNLEWVTNLENIRHAFKHNLNKQTYEVKIVYLDGQEKEFLGMNKASEFLGFNKSWLQQRVKRNGNHIKYGELNIFVENKKDG